MTTSRVFLCFISLSIYILLDEYVVDVLFFCVSIQRTYIVDRVVGYVFYDFATNQTATL